MPSKGQMSLQSEQVLCRVSKVHELCDEHKVQSAVADLNLHTSQLARVFMTWIVYVILVLNILKFKCRFLS